MLPTRKSHQEVDGPAASAHDLHPDTLAPSLTPAEMPTTDRQSTAVQTPANSNTASSGWTRSSELLLDVHLFPQKGMIADRRTQAAA
jgi:hypothetical protein